MSVPGRDPRTYRGEWAAIKRLDVATPPTERDSHNVRIGDFRRDSDKAEWYILADLFTDTEDPEAGLMAKWVRLGGGLEHLGLEDNQGHIAYENEQEIIQVVGTKSYLTAVQEGSNILRITDDGTVATTFRTETSQGGGPVSATFLGLLDDSNTFIPPDTNKHIKVRGIKGVTCEVDQTDANQINVGLATSVGDPGGSTNDSTGINLAAVENPQNPQADHSYFLRVDRTVGVPQGVVFSYNLMNVVGARMDVYGDSLYFTRGVRSDNQQAIDVRMLNTSGEGKYAVAVGPLPFSLGYLFSQRFSPLGLTGTVNSLIGQSAWLMADGVGGKQLDPSDAFQGNVRPWLEVVEVGQGAQKEQFIVFILTGAPATSTTTFKVLTYDQLQESSAIANAINRLQIHLGITGHLSQPTA